MSEKAYILSEIKEALHQAEGIDVLLTLQFKILELMECERVTIYTYDARSHDLVSAVKTGREIEKIRIPLNANSLAGGCICLDQIKTAKFLNISDVRNKAELSGYHSALKFDSKWDNDTGYRTRVVLCYPLIYSEHYIIGALQLINPIDREVFDDEDETLAESLATSLTMFLKKHITSDDDDYVLSGDNIESVRTLFKKHEIGYGRKGLVPTLDQMMADLKNKSERLAQYDSLLKKIK